MIIILDGQNILNIDVQCIDTSKSLAQIGGLGGI